MDRYLFIDESGDFNFSETGTPYYIITSILLDNPQTLERELSELKFKLVSEGHDIEYFHASEDAYPTREQVFSLIVENDDISIDSIIIEKRKTQPGLRDPQEFYSKMISQLITDLIFRINILDTNLIIITDSIPVKKHRKAVEKAIKVHLANMLPPDSVYQLLHHSSKSCFALQIADYCNWALYRKWAKSNNFWYDKIKNKIRSEYEVFRGGDKYYY